LRRGAAQRASRPFLFHAFLGIATPTLVLALALALRLALTLVLALVLVLVLTLTLTLRLPRVWWGVVASRGSWFGLVTPPAHPPP